MKYFVYLLFRDGELRPFYVGATNDPDLRERIHRKKYGKGIFLAVVFESPSFVEARDKEQALIASYLRRGDKLANSARARPYTPRSVGCSPFRRGLTERNSLAVLLSESWSRCVRMTQ